MRVQQALSCTQTHLIMPQMASLMCTRLVGGCLGREYKEAPYLLLMGVVIRQHRDILQHVSHMFNTINELLHTSNKAIAEAQSPEDLANDFGRFFVGKVTTIRNEVDNQSSGSLSINSWSRAQSHVCHVCFLSFSR